MKTKINRAPVAPKIRALQNGKSVMFPAHRYQTVNSTIYVVELGTGKKFVRKKIDDQLMVTRIR